MDVALATRRCLNNGAAGAAISSWPQHKVEKQLWMSWSKRAVLGSGLHGPISQRGSQFIQTDQWFVDVGSG
jgi:hypothetical protein